MMHTLFKYKVELLVREKSTRKAMYEVAKREILDKNSEIRNNLISLTHDHASSLKGISNGLIPHIRKEVCV